MSFIQICDEYYREMDHATTEPMRHRALKKWTFGIGTLNGVDRTELREENERRKMIRNRYCEEQRPLLKYYYHLELPTFYEVNTLRLQALRVALDPEILRMHFPFFAALPKRFKAYRQFMQDQSAAVFDRTRDAALLQISMPGMRSFRKCKLETVASQRNALRHVTFPLNAVIKRTQYRVEIGTDFELYRSFSPLELFKMLRLFPIEEDETVRHFASVEGGYLYLLFHLYCIAMALVPIMERLKQKRLIEFERPICIYDESYGTDSDSDDYDNYDIPVAENYHRYWMANYQARNFNAGMIPVVQTPPLGQPAPVFVWDDEMQDWIQNLERRFDGM